MIGWVGVFFGFMVGPAQLVRLLRTHETRGISHVTYYCLVVALAAYFIHALELKDAVFIVSNGVSLVVNLLVLVLLIKWSRNG